MDAASEYRLWELYDHCNVCRWSREIPDDYQDAVHIQQTKDDKHRPDYKPVRDVPGLLNEVYGNDHVLCVVKHRFVLEGFCCLDYEPVHDDWSREGGA